MRSVALREMETKMNHRLLRCLLKAALALLMSAAMSGCMRSYFTGPLQTSDLAGSWEVTDPDAKPQRAAEAAGGNLLLHADGTFEARHLPWTNTRGELEYADEVGEWKLIDQKQQGLRSRWKLSMRLTKRRFEEEWDVFVSGGPHPYLGLVYDLDSNDAVLFDKASR